jgi:hypothetical protein
LQSQAPLVASIISQRWSPNRIPPNYCLGVIPHWLWDLFFVILVVLISNEVKDLGVVFDSKLSHRNHLNLIVSKAYRNLGFVIRTTKDFNNLNCMKYLFNSLVRNGLEFASQIWTPQWLTYCHKIERVRKNFTRFLHYKSSSQRREFEDRLAFSEMNSLSQRRKSFDLMILYKLFNNLCDVDLSDRIVLIKTKPI